MIRRNLLLACVLTLIGCGHNLYFTGRTTGATASTTITTSPGHPSGEMTLELEGKVYRGRWLYMSGGGSVSLATMTATNGVRSATATGSAIGMPMQGNGSIILAAQDGSTLRCVFNYSEWSSSGIGECQDNLGETYDLQIGK
jgi:hypothetical protein